MMPGLNDSHTDRFLLQLEIYVSLLCISTSSTVYLSIDSNTVSDLACPEDLIVTIYLDRHHYPLTSLHMKPLNHFDDRARAFIFRLRYDGSYVIENKESKRCRSDSVGYYHDVRNDAHMKVTRTEDSPVMTGTLKIDGRSYKLIPESRYKTEKRETGQAYSLVTLDEGPPLEHRFRRQTHMNQELYLDITAVADYARYQHFLTLYCDPDKAIEAMNEYFAFVIFSADMRFRNITSMPYNINLRLNKVVVLETPNNFLNKLVVGDVLPLKNLMSELENYAKRDEEKILYPSDHIMYFTAHRLGNRMEGPELLGLANVATVCEPDGRSISVMRDGDGYQLVADLVVHEFGHSLSAMHDGDNNPCEAEDLYLMSRVGAVSDKLKGRTIHFSQCTIKSFNEHISRLLSTKNGRECLLEKLPVSKDVPDVRNSFPGQKYTPDEQCNMIEQDSVWCRRVLDDDDPFPQLCTSMMCGTTAGRSSSCSDHRAALGTSCGPGMMCVNQECVWHISAPRNVDNCTFGDSPGEIIGHASCSQMVRVDSQTCGQNYYRHNCCNSCRRVN